MNTQVNSSSDRMKGEESGNAGNPSWLVSLYQSVFQFIIGSIFLMLNVFQEFFKPGMGDKALTADDQDTKSYVAHQTSSGTGTVAPAGVSTISEVCNIKVDHTIVDLPSVESTGSTEKPIDVAPTVQTTPVPAFSFPSSYTPVEPTVDQSKNTLVIKNLPFKYKPVDLEALLAEHQTKPKNVRLLRDDAGRFSGMAFIRCISKEEAQRLIFSMNDLDIGGRNIQVEFKMKKKKKSKLGTSSDDASSLNSSSDELPAVNRLRVSSEKVCENATVATALAQVQPSLAQPSSQQEKTYVAPSGPRKLAVSAEHNFSDKFRKPPQMRRQSTSAVLDSAYAHSALYRIHPTLAQSSGGPSVRPIRQPLGPDGKSNGFSLEYRKMRGYQ